MHDCKHHTAWLLCATSRKSEQQSRCDDHYDCQLGAPLHFPHNHFPYDNDDGCFLVIIMTHHCYQCPSSQVRRLVDSVVSDGLGAWLESHPAALSAIVSKALTAARAAEAARKARELVRRKHVLTRSTLPGKLADCTSSKRCVRVLRHVHGVYKTLWLVGWLALSYWAVMRASVMRHYVTVLL
jgi:DNA gyrase B